MIRVSNKVKLLFVVIITIIMVYLGFEYILPLFIPFIIAYFIAWMLRPIVRFLYKSLKIPKFIGGMLSLALLGFVLFASFSWIAKILIGQLTILLKNMPIYLAGISDDLDRLCLNFDNFFSAQEGTVRTFVDSNIDDFLKMIKTDILPIITLQSMGMILKVIGSFAIFVIVILSIILFIKDGDLYKSNFKESAFYEYIHVITSKLSDTGIAYIKTQGIICIVIAILCSSGLFIINNKYALLIGIGIAVLDAFPVLGSGMILVPWAIISVFNKDLFDGAILMSIYLGCQIIREILEPKLLGNHMGIKPIFTLMSMYIGLKVFGISGFLLGPISLVVIFTIIKEVRTQLEI